MKNKRLSVGMSHVAALVEEIPSGADRKMYLTMVNL
jgi:hypothetical protein